MSYFLNFKSTNSCDIFVDSKHIGQVKDLPISVEVDELQSFILSIYPISEKHHIMPNFSVKMRYELNKLFCESDFVEVIPFTNNNYDIVINCSQINPIENIEKVYEKTINNINIVVNNFGKSNICVYKNGTLKYTTNIFECFTFNAYSNKDYILIQGSNSKVNNLIVLGPNFNEIYNDKMELVEFTKTNIKVLKKLCDIAKTGKVTEINYDNGKINSYYVYMDKKNVVNKNELVPYAFLECVKINNFELAKEYLSSNLKNKLTKSTCENFFGEIKEIYFNPYYVNDIYYNYTIKGNNYLSFNFKVKNQLIEEIEEIKF